jgi:hypothetical protein
MCHGHNKHRTIAISISYPYPISISKAWYPSKTLCLTRESEGSRRTGKLKMNTLSTLRRRKAEDSPREGQKSKHGRSMQGIEPNGHPKGWAGESKGGTLTEVWQNRAS